MKPRLKSSPDARRLIQRFEPFHTDAVQRQDGTWVVGYGHRAAARSGVQVSRDEAALLLIYDIMQAEKAIDSVTSIALDRHQRDALISFVHDIGDEAFKRSDIARYLYEGRAQAAGEAIVSYGEGSPDRREAESAYFATPPVPKPQRQADPVEPGETVELVIKVEHPGDETAATIVPVADQDNAVSSDETADATIAQLPEIDLSVLASESDTGDEIVAACEADDTPPPMPMVSASKLEAENEIARIIAAADAPVSDRDSDVEASGQVEDLPSATDPECQPEDASGETTAEESEAREKTLPGAPPPRQRQLYASPLDLLLGGNPGTRTIARMGPAVDDNDDRVDADDQSSAQDDEVASSLGDPATNPVETAISAFDPDPESADEQAQSSEVIANLSRELENVPTDIEAPHSNDATLPEGAAVGYVLAGGMMAHIDAVAAEEEEEANSSQEDVDERMAELAEAMRDDGGAVVDDEPGDDSPDASAQAAVLSRLEREITQFQSAPPVAAADVIEVETGRPDDDAPPLHSAGEPAASDGATGDVDGVGGDEFDAPEEIDDGEFGDIDGEVGDDLAPSDLIGNAAETEAESVKPAKHTDNGWGFLASFAAGAVVTGFGAWDVGGAWGEIWQNKTLSYSATITICGVFLMLTSGWMFVSGLRAKAKSQS